MPDKAKSRNFPGAHFEARIVIGNTERPGQPVTSTAE